MGRTLETQTQTLIERFDSRISTHISALVAIAFGAFTILAFLQGQRFPPKEWIALHLIFVEVGIFPFGVIYCLFRLFHYSRIIEVLKVKSKELGDMENAANEEALEQMPRVVRRAVKIRQELCFPQIVFGVFFGYLVWLGVVFVVLYL